VFRADPRKDLACSPRSGTANRVPVPHHSIGV
jgi:hypothetical protein